MTVALNRMELIKHVQETVTHPSDRFYRIDQETKEIEDITREQLKASDRLLKIDVNDERYKDDKNLDAVITAQGLIDESGDVKRGLQDHIGRLQDELKQRTIT